MATNTSLLDGFEYSDIATWEADKDGTSAAADTERLEISIVGSEAVRVVIGGWNNRTGGAEIQVVWLGDAFHDGNVNATSSNAYVIEALLCNEGACRIDGGFADKAIGSDANGCFEWGSSADGGDSFFLSCIANLNGETTEGFKGTSGATTTQTVVNCVSLNSSTSTSSIGFDSGSLVVYNSISYNMGRGTDGGSAFFNCWFLDSHSVDVRSGSYSYCAFNTEAQTPTKVIGNNDVALLIDTDTEAADTIRVTSLTAGSEDFVLLPFSGTPTNENWALGAGNDESGTVSEQANDIIGTVRSAQDVGAYEVITGGGPTLPIFDHHYRMARAA